MRLDRWQDILDHATDPRFPSDLGAFDLLHGRLQRGGVLWHPLNHDLPDPLALFDRQHGDGERGERIDLLDGGLQDVLVELAKGFVLAVLDPH